MQVTNCGRGIHAREVKGIDRLKSLPKHWYAFTNLELATGIGKSREIDVIIVADHLILLVDLKDWSGKIESDAGNWFHNGRDTGHSPVGKIKSNVKDVLGLLTRHLRGQSCPIPKIFGAVVVTGRADLSRIAATEKHSVFEIEKFIVALSSETSRRSTFGNVRSEILADPLTSSAWRSRLSKFFNVRNGSFCPGRRRYDRYVAVSEQASFCHPSDVYREYEAEEERTPQNMGTLRLWNFANCSDVRFQTEEGRQEIAGREAKVFYHLRDRNEDCENWILVPKAADADHSVDYWEVYDRRRRLKRLREFVQSETRTASASDLIELTRQVIARVAALHLCETAHLDLGGHSIWLEAPSTVKVSHLLAARFPEVGSLGQARYQFLASVAVPEDVLAVTFDGKRRDVFLLGVVAHEIIFGRSLENTPAGDPPEWNSSVDEYRAFEALHPWFERALEMDPVLRFADGAGALEAFNVATASRPSPREVIEGLERFRGSVRSQRQLFGLYPSEGEIAAGDSIEIWKSSRDGRTVKVKVWKRQAWGDQTSEGPRILAFLNRARDMQLSPPPHCASVQDVMWLGDAFALVQEWVEGQSLAASIALRDEWGDSRSSLKFIRDLSEVVILLHERGMAHGDLKPDNVIVQVGKDSRPILVDVLDFAPLTDGEVCSGVYSPETGSRQERDNFAVTVIASEMLAVSSMPQAVASAIDLCRNKEPRNATLHPLLEAIDGILAPPEAIARTSTSISLRGAAIGPLLADEGMFHLRVSEDRAGLIIRGFAEEIEVRFDGRGVPVSGRRRSVAQARIARLSKFEFKALAMDFRVDRADANDFDGLGDLLKDLDVARALSRMTDVSKGEEPGDAEREDQEDTGDIAEDRLVEEIDLSEAEVAADVDVPSLWRELIDAERELTTEGVVLGEGYFERKIKRHVVPFELSSGTFDFDKADTVSVEKIDARGAWRRVGELDTARSKPSLILIDATEYARPGQMHIVEENQRLRFTSHFEVESLRRRESATGRLLSRNAQVPELVDIFDPRRGLTPRLIRHDLDRGLVESYGLNASQMDALQGLLETRPLGLLQGPPGTGKTRFIAALAHYVLRKGLARNVLLASQSHEAVNNAAEEVLALLRVSGDEARILRVGSEGVVSERLLPFHAERVELLYKDRFRAQLRERLKLIGEALGIPEGIANELFWVESAIRPVCERMAELGSDEDSGRGRIASLRLTLTEHLGRAGLVDRVDLNGDPLGFPDQIVDCLLRRDGKAGVSEAVVARLRGAARIARDFLASASTRKRSFEPFLAGTRQVVAGTCVGLGRSSLGLTNTPFDLVIVDEAARCTASELSVPIQAGRWVVLVGDQKQLEPLHQPEVVRQVAERLRLSKEEVVRSDFERVFATRYGTLGGKRLRTQYRMLPAIGRLVSEAFYADLVLEHGRENPAVDPSVLPVDLQAAITWIQTDALGERAFEAVEPGRNSRINRVETDCIVALLSRWCAHKPFWEWLRNQTEHSHGIGVICMYAAQRDHLRGKLLRIQNGETLLRLVKVDTVDSYQGKQNPIVLVSLVRNNAEGSPRAGIATIKGGFLSRSNRINVSISRAMDRLVIVGARERWPREAPLSRVALGFEKAVQDGSGSLIEASDLLSGGRRGKRKRRVR